MVVVVVVVVVMMVVTLVRGMIRSRYIMMLLL